MLAGIVTVRLLPRGEALSKARDVPTVCLAWPDESGPVNTLRSIIEHTEETVPIVLAGAARSQAHVIEDEHPSAATIEDEHPGAPERGREIWALADDGDASFGRLANACARAIADSDVILVAPGVQVGPGWLDRLKAAAYTDSTIVSATALGDHAGPLSVRPRGRGRSDSPPIQPQAALAVASRSPRAYPRVASAGAHCVYLRRPLLERLDGFDPRISSASEAVAELSLRALTLGMTHVAADDVFVTCSEEHLPTGSTVPALDINDERTVLRRALACARTALHGMSVTIDARALGPGVGGTQRYTIELILALAAHSALHLRVVVPPDLPDTVARRFEQQPRLEVVTYETAARGVEPSDIVHRPQQVFTEDDLRLLRLLGDRVVIGQQDLIAYRNPIYHKTFQVWQQHRRVTRLALSVADRIMFFSQHAIQDALSEDLVTPDRCDIAGIGTDASRDQSPVPTPIPSVPLDRDMIVCLGADYRHKNRPFALALLEALRRRHRWMGYLVMAGPRVAYGSSREEEQELLAAHPELVEAVIELDAVDEAQRTWLFSKARAVLYPTLYEGFGLIPFEAARAGVPCLFGPQASLVELAGPEAATLVPWNAELSSDAVFPLLSDGAERQRHIRLLLDAANRAQWSEVVPGVIASYERTVAAPWPAAAPRAWQELEREQYISILGENDERAKAIADEYQRAYHDLRSNVGIGLPLVAEGGLLSRDEQRGLMRLASRRPLHRLLLAPVGLLGRPRAQTSFDADPDTGA